jgi:GNAT superfamily N-acetyltransferase
VGDERNATAGDVALVARIAAAGFHDDPVMSWVFADPATRLAHLGTAFTGLALDYLPDRGTVHVLGEACVTFWRPPSFHYAPPEPASDSPFPADAVERLAILDEAMAAHHPHDTPHWYLNVISTLPERQGQGLGGLILQPVLAVCDADSVPAYLESSNPRNMTLYRRLGFEQTGEITLPDGPALYPMWRTPGRS